MSKQINISDISTFRTQLMGFATLMIIACHAPASGVVMPHIMTFVLNLGNYGVDIFLLLSGLGVYYSLSKHPTWGGYYMKRITRIFVPYFLIYIPYCVVLILLGRYTLLDGLWCLSTLEYWIFHRGAWFVSLILILYLLSPLLFRIEVSRYKWIFNFALIGLIIFLCNINNMAEGSNDNVGRNVLLALGRVPCFILGMVLGQASKDGKMVSFWWTLLLAATFILIRRFFGITDGTAWMMAPLLLTILIAVIRWSKGCWLDSVLGFLGKISLESYLTNITINSILRVIIPAYFTSSLFYGRWLEYLFVIVVGIAVAYLVNNQSERIELKKVRDLKNN